MEVKNGLAQNSATSDPTTKDLVESFLNTLGSVQTKLIITKQNMYGIQRIHSPQILLFSPPRAPTKKRKGCNEVVALSMTASQDFIIIEQKMFGLKSG